MHRSANAVSVERCHILHWDVAASAVRTVFGTGRRGGRGGLCSRTSPSSPSSPFPSASSTLQPARVLTGHRHQRSTAPCFIAVLKCCRLVAAACAARTHYIRYFWFGNQQRRRRRAHRRTQTHTGRQTSRSAGQHIRDCMNGLDNAKCVMSPRSARARHARQEIPCFGLSSRCVACRLPLVGWRTRQGSAGRSAHAARCALHAVIGMFFYSLVPVWHSVEDKFIQVLNHARAGGCRRCAGGGTHTHSPIHTQTYTHIQRGAHRSRGTAGTDYQ